MAWKDNKAVYIVSNKYGMEPISTCSRFNRVEKKTVQVPQPACIKKYNSRMGGVDLLDNLVACYRIIYRILMEDKTNFLLHFLNLQKKKKFGIKTATKLSNQCKNSNEFNFIVLLLIFAMI